MTQAAFELGESGEDVSGSGVGFAEVEHVARVLACFCDRVCGFQRAGFDRASEEIDGGIGGLGRPVDVELDAAGHEQDGEHQGRVQEPLFRACRPFQREEVLRHDRAAVQALKISHLEAAFGTFGFDGEQWPC